MLNKLLKGIEKEKKKTISKKNPAPCFKEYSRLMGLNLRIQGLGGSMLENHRDVCFQKPASRLLRKHQNHSY